MFTNALNHHSFDHKEAVRLDRQDRFFSVSTLLICGFALMTVLSAVSSSLAVSPANGIP